MQSNSLEDGRPRPSRERERNHSVAVHCSRRHGSARRAVRSQGNFLCVPLCPLWLLINIEVTEERVPAERRSSVYFCFGATVSPKTDVCPCPATFNPGTASGLGK